MRPTWVIGGLIAGLCLVFSFAAHAQNNSWTNPASGKWEDPLSWSQGAPASSQSAFFITNANAKTVYIDTAVFASPATLTVSNLTVKGATDMTNTLSIADVSGGPAFTILKSGTISTCAQMRLTNSTLRISGSSTFTVDGFLWMTGGQMICTNAPLLVGSQADGQMIVSNGTVNTTQTWLSLYDAHAGTLTLVGSALTANGVTLSMYGNSHGTLWAVNGSQLLATNLFIGYQDSADMTISNSSCTVGTLLMGNSGNDVGTLHVAGGTVTVSQSLTVGNVSSSSGYFWLTGGGQASIVGDLAISQRGVIGVSNSTLTARNISLGGSQNGTAALIIDGSVVTGQGSLTAGGSSDSTSLGSVAITSGGQLILTNGSMILGNGYGRMSISNGTALVRDLLLGATASSSGSLTISAGTLQLGSTGTLEVRHGGALIAGGNVTVKSLIANSGAAGTLTFLSGTFTTQSSTVNNTYPFIIGDGTNPATYFVNGGVHSFANWLRISTNASLRGCGTIVASVVNDGTISVECPSALNFSGIVTNNTRIIIPNGMVASFAALVINNGTIDASAGGSVQFLGGVINNGTILLPPVPTAPSGLSATAVSSNHINLAWSDNSTNEAGFLIERAPDNSGVPGTWGQIDSVGPNVTTYSDAGLPAFTVFWYRVRAYNGYGNSPYSNQAVAGHTTNHVPVAVNDTVPFWVGSPQVSFNVFTNDFDVDGDVLTASSFTQPTRGTLSYIGNGVFTYQPGASFTNGQDQFSYTIQDGFGGTDTATVLLDVQAHYLDAGDWPTFGNGPSHTGYYPGIVGDSVFVASWSNSFPMTINPIAVGAGKVYATLPTFSSYNQNPFYLAALDTQTGQQAWRYDFANNSAWGMNPPTYADGKIYTQRTNEGYDSQLWCISTNGTLVWSAPWDAQDGTYYAPCVSGDGVWIGGGSFSGMYGFSTNGTQRFFYHDPQLHIEYAQWTPTYYQGTLYAWLVGTFRAHDPIYGTELWSINIGGGYSISAIDDGRAFVMQPRLYAIDLGAHSVTWSQTVSFAGSPAVHNGIVYAITGDEVRSYRAKDGTYLGTYKATNDTSLGFQPIITDDAVLVASSTNTYVFNLLTHQLKQMIPYGGTLAVSSGRLYMANGNMLRTFAIVSPADLAISLTDTPDPVEVGSNLTYAISVTNSGPGTASASVVTDTLPAGVVYMSAVSSQGTCVYSNGVVTCTLGDIANGTVATATIVVVPTAPAVLSNIATVQAASPDPVPSNNSATVTTTAADAGHIDRNGDGLPDSWQIAYFGSANAPNACPSCDPDGDGMDNLQEYLAGTNPTNGNSVLRITAMARAGADTQVYFTSVGGQYYSLQRCDFMGGAWTDIVTNIPGNDGIQWTKDIGGATRTSAFYRIRLSQLSSPPPADSDNDGVLDTWTQKYFGHPTGQGVDHSLATDDADGDGLSNLQEFLAGTDPTTSASSFRIISVLPSGIDLLVTWMMGSGRTNALQVTTDDGYATNSFTDLFTVTNTVGSVTNYLDAGAVTNGPSRFYRIRLVP